jgi:hypothetical protein
MRPRSVIFILLQLSLSFVAAARSNLERWGGIAQCRPEGFAGQQGHRRSERGGALSREQCKASVDINVIASIHDRAEIL